MEIINKSESKNNNFDYLLEDLLASQDSQENNEEFCDSFGSWFEADAC